MNLRNAPLVGALDIRDDDGNVDRSTHLSVTVHYDDHIMFVVERYYKHLPEEMEIYKHDLQETNRI